MLLTISKLTCKIKPFMNYVSNATSNYKTNVMNVVHPFIIIVVGYSLGINIDIVEQTVF